MIITEPSRISFLLLIPSDIAIICLFSLKGAEHFPILNSGAVQHMGRISYTFFVMQSFWKNFVTIYLGKIANNAGILVCVYFPKYLLLKFTLPNFRAANTKNSKLWE